MANSTVHWQKPKQPKNRLYFHFNKNRIHSCHNFGYWAHSRANDSPSVWSPGGPESPDFGHYLLGLYVNVQKIKILLKVKLSNNLISNVIVAMVASIHLSKRTAWKTC